MIETVPLHCWAARLEALCATLPPLHRVRVMAEIDTTQDLACDSGIGTLVTTDRQRAGRGQRGNRWADTGESGLAISICLPSTSQPERAVVLDERAAGGHARPAVPAGAHVPARAPGAPARGRRNAWHGGRRLGWR